mmetsp:Transcript_24390/g.74448  ORF Transcript_24390/g.74448 Transcript_24390/m.74448 type:complete len:112 (+) Transcript_24390:258-593(+)
MAGSVRGGDADSLETSMACTDTRQREVRAAGALDRLARAPTLGLPASVLLSPTIARPRRGLGRKRAGSVDWLWSLLRPLSNACTSAGDACEVEPIRGLVFLLTLAAKLGPV